MTRAMPKVSMVLKLVMNRFNKHIAMSGPASLFYIHNHSNNQEDTDVRK